MGKIDYDRAVPHRARKDARQALAHGYNLQDRLTDSVSIILFFVMEAYLVFKISPLIVPHLGWFAVIMLIGYIGADFISGFVHWLGDTWGTPATPFFGNRFIRPFREHHVDQTAITRHDFIETNGANCFATVLLLLPFLIYSLFSPLTTPLFFVLSFILAVSLGLFGTNQFHKWAHGNAPRFVSFFQDKRLILSPTHHKIHHSQPFDTYYCITIGWMNPILKAIKFFPRLEWLITKITGAKPRENDTYLTRED
jgi:hypothetical protein